ncbi:MAG: transporter substrate-binding protein [Anaerocolumna sp.]|nr:transporter substrate-binding protein [Anaerocolumna sp.]
MKNNKITLYKLIRIFLVALTIITLSGCKKPHDKEISPTITNDDITITVTPGNTDTSIDYDVSKEKLVYDILKDGAIYKITNKASGRSLNMQLSGMVNGSTVIQYADTNMLDELWRVERSGDYYTIQSLLTPRNIAVRKNSDKVGSIIEVRIPDKQYNLAELWTFKKNNDSIQIISAKTNLTIGLTENTKKSSSLPQLLEFQNEDWQLWNFEEVNLQDELPYLLPVDGALFHSSCPEIVKYGDTYYMYIMAPNISIKASKDLINWTSVGTVFKGGDPSWLANEVPGYGIWAPGVYKIKDKYYLYYCISTSGSQNSAIGIAENVTLDHLSPDYKWVDKGMVIRSNTGDDYNCIDPNIITDENGDVWLTFGSYWNGIYQRQIDPDTGLLLEDNAKTYHIAKRFANNGAIEAPYIIKRDNYYYLFTAFNPMNNSYHNRVGRSTSIHGPFVDKDGKPMLEGGGTPFTQGLSELLMPGHASIFKDDDGQYYLVSEYFRKNSPSIMLIGTIIWDKDGWPISPLTPEITTILQQ